MQMWVLLRSFPFLVAEMVEKGNSHMQLLLLLLHVMEIIFAPKLTKSSLPYLEALVHDLVESFHTLFPNVNLINKFHHLFHYAESISWSGPMWGFICLRYEARHAEIKLRA